MSPARRDDDDELSAAQKVFWQSLTDQRIAGLFLIVDIFNDASGDGVAFLRALGNESDEAKALRRFLLRAKPETLDFLTELREREVEDIEEAIETARSIKRTGRVVRWGAITMTAAFLGIVAIWDKLVLLWTARGK